MNRTLLSRPGLLLLAAGLILGLTAVALPLQAQRYVRVADTPTLRVAPGGTSITSTSLRVKEGWHVNANPASAEYLIPTSVDLADTEGLTISNREYPPGRDYRFSFAEESIKAYQDTVPVQLEFKAGSDLEAGTHRRRLVATVQPCDDQNCLPPRELLIPLTVTVDPEAASETLAGGSGHVADPGLIAVIQGDAELSMVLESRGLLLGLLIVFLLGMALNLTPCVYPMIPVTVGYFSDRKGSDSLLGRFGQAGLFVAGLVLIYTILGALAAWSGSMLGLLLQQPPVLVTIALILTLLAGSMFGFYDLTVPEPVLRESETFGRSLGSFGMGMTLGVIAAPCLAPATVALLVYVGQSENIFFGAGMFFVLSLGMGLPYLGLAIFSRQLRNLPGSGRWLKWVKVLLGFVVLSVAWYFLWGLLSTEVFTWGLIALISLAAGVLSFVVLPDSTLWAAARGFCLTLVAVLLATGAHANLLNVESPIDWQPFKDHPEITEPTMVYVRADWCPPCKQMEVTTFRSERLAKRLAPIRTLKLDATRSGSRPVQEFMNRHRVIGVPTILFLDEDGVSLEELRVDGYLTQAQLSRRVESFKESVL